MTMLLRRSTSKPKHKGKRLRDEASNSFALFIVMAPVIFGAFGVGLDFSRNVFIRTELQNALDMATVSGAGVTLVNDEGALLIDKEGARDAMEKVYALNRENASVLDCWGPKTTVTGTDMKMCWKPRDEEFSQRQVSFTVRERSQNAFLTVIGLKWQTYEIRSHAIINQQAQ